MRRKIVAANWKMNGSLEKTKTIINELISSLNKQKEKLSSEIIICPPSIYLLDAVKLLNAANTNSLNISIGAQNCFDQDSGAFTGEISALMLQDIGCKYVIVGHSERRQIFSENNDLIINKVKSALKNKLIPILCVGESESERNSNNTFAVLKSQLEPVLQSLDTNSLNKLIVAYEPVWAIGTGVTATPFQAEEVHAFIRNLIRDYSLEVSHNMPIIYGGSVKANNAKELFSMPNIDGGLVGGASLIAEEFSNICIANK